MRFVPTLLGLVVAGFPLSEVALAIVKRSGRPRAEREDHGSMRLLWVSIILAVFLAALAQGAGFARIAWPRNVTRLLALGLLLAGLGLRWAAILTLGRFFTVDIAIHSGHRVIQSGVYRSMRHPSYSGLLVAFLGLGLYFENWLSVAILLIPIAGAVVNRVTKEERMLLASLGDEYAAYCARTRRFIPGVL